MKCKNIECENETTGKRVYCSLTCRNVYVNKHIRNYDSVSNFYKNKKKKNEEEYLENPKKCLYCENVIPYDSREKKYCNHSCSARYTNTKRNCTWGNKIRESIHKYLVENKIKDSDKIGLYDLTCKGCGVIFQNNRKEISYCSSNCRRIFKRKNMDEYQKYRLDCNFKFNLADYAEEFDFGLVEKYGWYSPSNKKNNLDGVSRDHIFSVKEGFELGIDPKLISHPANCQLMIHNQNVSKNKKSNITIDELIEKINIFELKYGKVN